MAALFPFKAKHIKWLWILLFFAVLSAITIFFLNSPEENPDPLTTEEREWLKAHPVIRFAPDPNFPPTEYFDRDGVYCGITADYLSLIEKKLGIKFTIVRLRNWDEILDKARHRQIDIFAATKTPPRSAYALFTRPFLELPAVIIARENAENSLAMDSLSGMKVSVVSGYAVQEFITKQYPDITLDVVSDVQIGLRKVSFGTSDAFVENIASASYYIDREGITNLRVAGESGFTYSMAFASRSDWPILNRILEKGLGQISPAEKAAIYRKWVPLEPISLFTSKGFKIALLILVPAAIVLVAGIFTWNRMLRRQVHVRTSELQNELVERQRVEEALRFTQFAIDRAQDQAFWMNENGLIFYVNDAACRALGYTREELVGMSFQEIDPQVSCREFSAHWHELKQKGSVSMESLHRAKNGRMHPVEIRANHVVFDGKEYNCVFATDITERKKAEESLRESEEKFRVLAETTPAAIILYQGEQHIYCNPYTMQVTGYTERELLNMRFWDWMHDDYREQVRQNGLARQRGDQVPVQYEAKCLTKSGKVKWILISAGRIEYRGAPAGIVSILDITQRKQMEIDLREARDDLEQRVERRTAELAEIVRALGESEGVLRKLATELDQKRVLLRTLIDSIPDIIFYKDTNSVYLGCNKAFEFLAGCTEKELVGRTDLDIFPGELAKFFREMDRKMLSLGSARSNEEWVKYPDGRSVLMETLKTPYRMPDGTICGLIGIGRDITERKIAEEQLKRKKQQLEELNNTLEIRVRDEVEKNRAKDLLLIQQNRQAALGELLDHIAHQWKQPLNSVSLLISDIVDAFSSGELTADRLNENTARIHRLVGHMAQTITIFRNFYQPEKKASRFIIKDVVEVALSFISPAMKFERINVILDVDPILAADGYPKEYAQVLLNILGNARDAFKDRETAEPRITITAAAEGGNAVVTISDNAGGIPESSINRIFDLYFTTREATGGSGIGLYLSKTIIETNMGGKLSAANIADGAQFRIELTGAG